MDKTAPTCARCGHSREERACVRERGKGRPGCPTLRAADLIALSRARAQDDEHRTFVLQAAIQEGSGYMGKDCPPPRPALTRLEETALFAERMGYARLGLAFCMGLRAEAAVIDRYFTSRGFTVVSACCKVGRIFKSEIGLTREQQVNPEAEEPLCNPIMQALLMNEQKVDFNILVGLCVGHDSLFLKTAEAPCTVLIAKDRLLAHNPVGAVYQYEAYYRCLERDARRTSAGKPGVQPPEATGEETRETAHEQAAEPGQAALRSGPERRRTAP